MESHHPYQGRYPEISRTFPQIRRKSAALSEEDEPRVRAWIARETQTIRDGRRLQWRLAGALVVVFLCSWNPAGFVLFPVFNLLILAVDRRIVRRQNEAGQRLAQRDHARVVGPLIDMMAEFDRSAVIEATLAHLLPRLRAADANLLTPRRRKHLVEFLKDSRSTLEFQLAILRALEQIGDEQAIPVVEHLARASRRVAVRCAAQECLPFLYACAEQERLRRHLLLPAFPPAISVENLVRSADAATDDLLRPLQSTDESEPRTLLRSHPPQVQSPQRP